MATHNQELEIGAQLLLAALVAVACIAGIPLIVDTVAQSLAQSKARSAGATLACRACGMVEGVREVTLGATDYEVSTVSGERFAMILGLLSGKLGAGPVEIYEVAVRLEDGSTRILRQGAPPEWKPGDRVKIVMGRIRPAS